MKNKANVICALIIAVMFIGIGIVLVNVIQKDYDRKESSVSSSQIETKTESEKFAEKNNISPKLAKSLEKVLSDMKLTDKSRVGVFHYTLSDVSDWKQTNDWAEGKRYSGYMAQEHIFYFYEKNDEIVGVRTSNNEVLYQKKEK